MVASSQGGAGGGRRLLLGPPTTVRLGFSACGAPRSGSPSPPTATWLGPFVSAALRPFVPGREVASSGEPAGPVPDRSRSLTGDPVTITRSGQSPLFKPVFPHTSASQLGRSEVSEPRRGGRDFYRNLEVIVQLLNVSPGWLQGTNLQAFFWRGDGPMGKK